MYVYILTYFSDNFNIIISQKPLRNCFKYIKKPCYSKASLYISIVLFSLFVPPHAASDVQSADAGVFYLLRNRLAAEQLQAVPLLLCACASAVPLSPLRPYRKNVETFALKPASYCKL